jgi:hypothetical protein
MIEASQAIIRHHNKKFSGNTYSDVSHNPRSPLKRHSFKVEKTKTRSLWLCFHQFLISLLSYSIKKTTGGRKRQEEFERLIAILDDLSAGQKTIVRKVIDEQQDLDSSSTVGLL